MTVRVIFDEFSSSRICRKEDQEDSGVMKQLDDLIGLRPVKTFVKEIRAMTLIRAQRQENGLAVEPLVLHMLFSGNPGSGKSTVARIMADLFKEMGILCKGHLVECERADLVGEYVGPTAQKTRGMVQKAAGGVLFVDEAYSLMRGGEKDFGKEAVDVLVKAMEDRKNDFVLILAGYKSEMEEFLRTNPGLRSRFPLHLDFPDYTIKELLLIADVFLKQRDYVFDAEARAAFGKTLDTKKNEHCYAGNARLVRNLIEQSIRRQAVRLIGQSRMNALSREDLKMILPQDLNGS
ncbi:MAG: AAA family ATPase [Gracilibacteraceae bacterium]|jgi:stage V sporulation protein K|nr:AAA family ATPase [Gracilibacteraceae bacterium]